MQVEKFYVIRRNEIPEEFEGEILYQMEEFGNGCYVPLRLYDESDAYDRTYGRDRIPLTEWVKSQCPDVDIRNVLVDWSW